MKKKNINYVIVVLIVIGSCKKIDKLTQFNMEFNETATVPSTFGVNTPFDVLTPDITTNSTSTFSGNNTRKDLIEEIRLTELNLKVITPSNEDFSFLKSISIYISANGLSEIKIAYADNIPNNGSNTLSLCSTGINLKEYLIKDSFSLRLSTTTDEIIGSDYEINIHSVFYVDAKILGQ